MRLRPRTRRTIAAALLACALCLGAQARQAGGGAKREARQAPKPGPRKRSAAGLEAAARARRETLEAVAALKEVAEAARTFGDAPEGVFTQAEAADALWPYDEQAARAVLRLAWERTTAPGAADAFAPKDDPRFDALSLLLAAREEVIARAARHDARLAESLLAENARDLASRGAADRERGPGGDEEPAGPHDVWRHPSPEALRRLSTANALLRIGDYAAAAAFAAPVIAEGVSRPLLDFILALRAHAPGVSDSLHLRLIERTRLDASADANDVLLLSAPFFSPDLRVSIGRDGSTHFMDVHHDGPAPPGESMPRGLRRAFLDTAAAVLLRPPPRRAADAGASGATMAQYFAVGRLLPLFDAEAPQHSAHLRARMAALTQEIDEARRESASAQMGTRSLRGKNAVDPLRFELGEIGRAGTEAERDAWRIAAVSNAADRRLWDRARRLAGEIADAATRRAAFTLIALRQVTAVLESFEGDAEEDFARAADFVRAADVPPAARAVGLAQAAELAARKGRLERASALFEEAESAASSVERGGELHVSVRTLLAASAARVKGAPAWEMLARLSAALDEADARPGVVEDECAGVRVESPAAGFCVGLADQLPAPGEVFAAMARLDPGRALAEARGLKNEVTRAGALLAAARAVLEKNAAAGGARAR